jgi:ArsR family metal-binding transcriptional regulator
MDSSTTFPRLSEWEKAKQRLDSLTLPYRATAAAPAYRHVGTVLLTTTAGGRSAISEDSTISTSGWVDASLHGSQLSSLEPEQFQETVFESAHIMVLAPCIADIARIRIIAHIHGDLTEVLPYLNAEMPGAFYNPNGPTLMFMEGYRMVVLYPHRISVAKADDVVDAWRILEMIRLRVNRDWSKRSEIVPSNEMRRKPPALEIYKRLPGTNCRQCGEKTCMAFALRLWGGEVRPDDCLPIFEGEYGHLKEGFLEICMGLGMASPND